MVQSNKILTVSYGTFSCTLEGFDDAFGTMKAIAEYFRDLAAEDRYFGAEPPQPDADMLAHIAQKEIARRVEAHRDETGFVLRAEQPAAEPAVVAAPAAAVAAAAAADAVDELVEAQVDAVDETDAPADEAVEAAIEEAVAQDDETQDKIAEEVEAEAVEEDAEEIAELAEDAEAEAEIQEDAAAEAEADEEPQAEAGIAEVEAEDSDIDESEEVDEDADADAEIEIAAEADESDIDTSEEIDEDADADIEIAAEAEAEAEDAIAGDEDNVEDEAAPEAVAAFFADTQDDSAVYDDDTVEHDMVAPDVVADEADIEETVAEDVEEAPTRMSAAESIAAKLQRIRAVVSRRGLPETEDDFIEDEHADAASAEDTDEVLAPPMTASLEELQDLDAIDAETEQDDNIAEDVIVGAEDDSDEDDVEVSDTLSAILSEDAALEEALEDDQEAQSQAHLVKVTREEFDAILAADRDEAEAAEAESDGSLSEEDEADLLRELAEVEAEMDDAEPAEEIAADDVAENITEEDAQDEDEVESIFAEDNEDDIAETEKAEAEETAEATLSDDADEDTDISRLLEEAADKLGDDSTSSRRSEFAHLRAAMAAGKAEEAAGGSMSEAESDGAYREDLARVVRPRRPESAESGERTSRPQDEKPAPLKLVAAQRVDAETAPVQPRRVMSTPVDDVIEGDGEGKMKFADYAASLGAVELPDLLEAAASYLSFVEGQEQFSRPQLMTKVRMVEKEDFSREDGLRSFGLLLRDGKIEKTQAGRFTVSDRIGFRPDDTREAG